MIVACNRNLLKETSAQADDLNSENAKPVNSKLRGLGLPGLVDVRDEFERRAAC